MEQRARDVIKIGDKLFGDKTQLDSLNQEIALNFYPERADFTDKRNAGEEFSDHLFSSYPVMARRELGNMLAASLRPRSQRWFSIHIDDEDLDARDDIRAFLERITSIQWRAMYDDDAGLVQAANQADHDFAAFGNAVIKFGPNLNADGLLFQNFHLRDNAWSMNAQGKVDANHRNWCPTARQLVQHFGSKKVSKDVNKAFEKDPEKTFDCRHVVLPTRLYNYKNEKGKAFPFVSLYVEKQSETVLEEVGLNYFCYVIPRWHTVSGSQYGTSMATSICLPDGRTLQIVTRTIREAGEKYVDPPMLSFHDAIRGDYNLYAGGITTADVEYDERLGEVLRPLTQDKGGFPIGAEIAAALRQDIREAFFLDKIQLPETGKDMTAFEVRRRVEEHIRAASPIFEPMEHQYNAPLCEGVFQVMKDHRAFPFTEMPEELENMETQFSFRTPLADFADQRDAEVYIDGMTRVVIPAAQIDPSQVENVDLTESTRSALRAMGWKQKWFKPVEVVRQRQQELQKAAVMAKGMETLGAATQVAEQGGNAAIAINEATAPPA